MADPQYVATRGTIIRNSGEPRVGIFFTARSWEGVPEICEPHKCTELLWADPETLPADALEFISTAWNDAQNGHVLREFGFIPISP